MFFIFCLFLHKPFITQYSIIYPFRFRKLHFIRKSYLYLLFSISSFLFYNKVKTETEFFFSSPKNIPISVKKKKNILIPLLPELAIHLLSFGHSFTKKLFLQAKCPSCNPFLYSITFLPYVASARFCLFFSLWRGH